jgi:tetratricopeptide (TPR) repeat protein
LPALLAGAAARTADAEDAAELMRRAYAKSKAAESVEQYGEVIDLCERAAASQPSDEIAAYAAQLGSWARNRRGELQAEQAASLLAAGDHEAARDRDALALADFEKAVELDPKRWKAFHNRGVSYALAGKYEAAITDFNQVLELKPDYANTSFNLGEIYLELGELDEAVKHYSAALDLLPDDHGTLVGRGQAYARLGQLQESLSDLNRAIELDPERAVAFAARAETYQQLAMWEEAAKDYREANRWDAESHRVLQGAAWLMATCPEAQFRNAELAVQAAERALQLSGTDHPRYLDTLAAAYANAGRFEDAVRTIERARNQAAGDEQVRAVLEARRELYESNQPFRQTPAAPAATDPSTSPPPSEPESGSNGEVGS